MCVCAYMLLVALMQSDRDEWSWTTWFWQQGIHGVESGGSYLHIKAKREEMENMQVRRGKERWGGKSEKTEGEREIENVEEKPEGGG